MKVRPGIEQAGLSDLGCQRENNEDRFSYWEPESDEEFARKGRLAIVADGMGGYEGGQEASRIAVEVIEGIYADSVSGGPRSWLIDAFQSAHEQIQRRAAQSPDLLGMGTTCTALVLLDQQLYFAHVGDSRLYLVRKGTISRLTRDHSYVSRLVESGAIRAEEAESHPQRHILTAALGAGSVVVPDSPEQPVPLDPGCVLVLCSDGLWSQVNEREILDATADKPCADSCRELIDLARQRGGPDNITVQVLRVT